MTGRRLYEIVTDEIAFVGRTTSYARESTQFTLKMLAWADLSGYEKALWGRAAARLKGVKR